MTRTEYLDRLEPHFRSNQPDGTRDPYFHKEEWATIVKTTKEVKDGRGFDRRFTRALGQKVVESVKPLQARLLKHAGELVMVHRFVPDYAARTYNTLRDGDEMGEVPLVMQVGTITKDTQFPGVMQWWGGSNVLLNVNCPARINDGTEEGHKLFEPVGKEGSIAFSYEDLNVWFDVLNRDVPIADRFTSVARGGIRSVDAPRMPFYIGDAEVVPVLESTLGGWMFPELESLLKREVPKSANWELKLAEEQRELVIAATKEIDKIRGVNKARMGWAEELTGLYKAAKVRGYLDSPTVLHTTPYPGA